MLEETVLCDIMCMQNGVTHVATGISEDELREITDRLTLILESTDEGIYGVDRNERCIFINKAASNMLGYEPEEVLGKRSHSLWHSKHIDGSSYHIEQCGIYRALKNGEGSRNDDDVFWTKDGKPFPVEYSTYPIVDKGKIKGGVVTFTDITERKTAEEARLSHQSNLEAVRRIGVMANSSLDLSKVLDNILTGTLEAVRASVGMIFAKNPQTNCLEWGASKGLSRAFVDDYKDRPIRLGEGLTGLIAQTGDSIFIEKDSSHDPRIARPVVVAEKLNSFVGLPVRAGDDIVAVMNILTRPPDVLDAQATGLIAAIGTHVGFAIRNAQLFAERKQAEEALQKALNSTIRTVVSMSELRDPYTAGHEKRVTQLACAIAEGMNLGHDRIEDLRMACSLHDIGKICIPAEILSRAKKLSESEYDIIKAHCEISYDIMKQSELPERISQIVLQHHENMNGSGYPKGLSGDEITTGARILRVADVVEAMSSHRPYRPTLGITKALDEVSTNKGVLYDPEVVDNCLNLFYKKHFKFK